VLVGAISLMLGAVCEVTLLIQIEERAWHKLSTVEVLALIAPIVVLLLWWQIRVVPRFCRVRIAPDSEALNFPISLEKSQKL
jgi:hypothetical protein